ncbi:uncharacterized protein [Choristoneura fumiferana]|uniref:uncharacterized protein n=1 Tax=Choristoneura fumiferana TaxID=7141 RepID=UPI003D15B680
MCEIFPEVQKCCFIVPIRVGLIFIAVLAIMTGTVAMSVLVKKTGTSYKELSIGLSRLSASGDVLGEMRTVVRTGVSLASVLFMSMGVVLLIANLTDSNDLAMMFVWGIMAIVIIGVGTIACVTIECMVKDTNCLLSGMDWFSAAFFLVATAIYLFVWLYFAAVTNTYGAYTF